MAVRQQTISYDAEVKHDGRLHRFHIPCLDIDKCENCGEVFFANCADEEIAEALRAFLGLLQPAEIRRRLSELGLTQREFANRIGVAIETVSRWLSGSTIQTRALDNLMRLFLASAHVRDLLPLEGPTPSLGFLQADSNATRNA